jgi:uncharacterized protein
MSPDVLENAIRKILGSPLTGSRLMILWHAGEPLTAGLPFYEYAVSIVNHYKPDTIRVEHLIQTNATILTDKWCRFLRQKEFHIGVSLDGPQLLHDKHRRSWANQGSFQRAMAGIARLQDHGIEFGVLAVLTVDSLAYADEIYDFFKSLRPASVGFNVEEIENLHTSCTFDTTDFSKIRAAYYRFFARLIERVRADPEPLKIREIEKLLKATVRIRRDSAYVYEPLEASPFRMLTILHNGDVTPFNPELAGVRSDLYQNFNIGNICGEDLEQIVHTFEMSLLKSDAQRSRDLCQSRCQYFQLCGGTYFSNKWSENGSLLTHETLACRLHSQTIIDAFLDYISD